MCNGFAKAVASYIGIPRDEVVGRLKELGEPMRVKQKGCLLHYTFSVTKQANKPDRIPPNRRNYFEKNAMSLADTDPPLEKMYSTT